MARLFLPFLITVFLAGCSRRDTVERFPNGEPKRVHEYSWFGVRDSLNLRRAVEYTLEGRPAYDVRYRHGRPHGEFRAYWDNGQLREQGRFREGKRDGEWIFYFNRFTPSAKGSYGNGLKQGVWTEFWEDNNLRRRGEYRDGKEIGEWVGWSSLGAEIERNSCFPENGRGKFRSFHENGYPKEEYECLDGRRFGLYSEHDALGRLLRRGFYDTSGSQDSLWESFHPDEKPASRRHYRHGLMDDSVLAWDPAGHLVERGFFRAGTGSLTRYDSLGGAVEIQPMVAGKAHGENWKYHPGGRKRQLTVNDGGNPQSIHRWHPNGKTAAKGGFREGNRTGLWLEWDSLGTLRESSHYENGMLHGERRFFDSTGALIRVQKYFRGIASEGWFPKLPGGMKKKR